MEDIAVRENTLKPFLIGSGIFGLFFSLSTATLWQLERMPPAPLLPALPATLFAQDIPKVPAASPLFAAPSVAPTACLLRDETLPHECILEVGDGDTLARMLGRENVPTSQIHQAIQALEKHYSPRKLRPRHRIALTLARPGPDAAHKDLHRLSIQPKLGETYIVKRADNGTFRSEAIATPLQKQEKHVTIQIRGSLYHQLAAQGVPASIITEVIRVLSFKIDLQRNLKTGDTCEIAYSHYHDPASGQARPGELIFAHLNLSKQQHAIYRFQTAGGVGYYNADGKSIRGTLLCTPVDGARISSHFSARRRHPVLGFTREHRGVDFAAPTGTPIMAAGAGVVVKAGWVNGYGRYILLYHNGEYSTAYAHLNSFKKGLQKGTRVRQGEIIGYVGASGLASGPHLHYEVIKNGKQINPLEAKSITTQQLQGNELKAFKAFKSNLETRRAQRSVQT